jgi:PIN domain nuclease of toxin-antitoxin system
MKVLLDRHAALWFIEGDSQLSAKARNLIEDTTNEVFISIISLFEISVKYKIGKLSLQKPLDSVFHDLTNAYIEILPINNLHLLQYQHVPMPADHRDPFDRLIIATAMTENAQIISVDQKFENYRELVTIIW